ncbi:MAG: long-chain fatty acid--CoA ligase [Polyangiaceae bacterium]|nr:long-chain fatty acid--CoA ligase [Polyangiaceae bacterium]
MPADTIVHRLFEQADRRPDAPALFEKRDGIWRAITYRSYAETVRRVGRALLSLGFQPGNTVSLLGFNRPEWVYMALGSMSAGGAGAGIYTTSSPSEIAYIVGHAESKVILVESRDQWAKVEKVLHELPLVERVVLMRGAPRIDHPKVLSWEAFVGLGDSVTDERLLERVHALEPGGVASLIYTSGTTGPPKGVMLSHGNLAFTAHVAKRVADARPGDCSLSYLPLSHIAEQMFSIHGPITIGSSIYFAESLDKVPDNLKEIQPTIFFGVPRIWEKFHAGISGKLTQATGVKKRLVEWARRVGTSVSALRMRGEEPTGLLAMEYKLAKKAVFDKLKPAIGLGRARFCVTGAAPIAKEILEFFASLDIVILEVYGQSEDCGPTSCNLNGRAKLGSVGPAVDGVEVKIADDGEILVRGPNVFLGYLKDEAATSETLIDGWLHSGDLGAFDADGFLSITGRKKEIIITAGGKNIAPKNIESALKNHPFVSEAVVIGDRRKFLTALVTLENEAAAAFAKEKGLPTDRLHELAPIREEIQKALDAVNAELARVETVKKFTILPNPFSIDSGELTPTLKVKRKIVNDRYSKEIEAMYQD